jgi:hypothetical protein
MTCMSATLSTTHATWTGLGLNPGLWLHDDIGRDDITNDPFGTPVSTSLYTPQMAHKELDEQRP